MAKAILVPPQPIELEIQLTLSRKEAETLMAIANHVGGSSTLSRRGHVDSVRAALYRLEVSSADNDISKNFGSIYFEPSK